MRKPRFLKSFDKSKIEKFSSKIYLTHLFSIVVISVCFTAFFIHYQKKSRTEILINKGELLAGQLAENARIGVFAENAELFSDSLDSVLRQEEVLAVRVFTDKGELLASRERTGGKADGKLKKDEPGEELNMLEQLKKSCAPVHLLKENSIDFWTPVQYKTNDFPSEVSFYSSEPERGRMRTIGYVRLVLGKKQLRESFNSLLWNGVLIATVFLILALAAAYAVTKSITRPLKRLKESVNSLANGASFEKVPVETGDEVGELAASFNTMADSLKMREMEKDQLAQQLLHAQKMEAVGTLAGGIAHDFNNILTGIIGYGDLLRDELPAEGPCGEYIGEIINSANRAADLTQRLLAFSRKQVTYPKVINLNESILNLNKLLLRIINENIEFRVDLTTEDLFILADEGQIEQVLINLAANARDAMPAGGQLTIATKSVRLDNGLFDMEGMQRKGIFAVLTVTDSGSGIDTEIKDRLFDPFFTTKEVGKGTGLGLSIVYGIISRNGGFIDVDSEPGIKTTFSIYLPLTDPSGVNEELESLPLPKGNNETILLAEDDFTVRVLGKNLLTKYGYRVIDATDGEDALAKFIEHKDSVQVLLLDVIMPKKNGKQVYDEIREMRPGIKTLFTSGYTFDVLDKQDVPAEGLYFIPKPLQPYELLSKLRVIIAGE
jgi:signal transduction histidine kinase/CheY-like chemotaxis protein